MWVFPYFGAVKSEALKKGSSANSPHLIVLLVFATNFVESVGQPRNIIVIWMSFGEM